MVHLALLGLVSKGAASFIRRGRIKVYQPANPRELLRLFDERRSELEKILPLLEARRKQVVSEEAEVYEGLNGLKNMCFKLIDDTSPGDLFLFFAFRTPYETHLDDVYAFYREYAEIRMRRGLVLLGIAPRTYQEVFRAHDWPHHNIVYVDIPTLHNLSICNDKVIFTPWDQQKISFLVSSKPLADDMRRYFFSIWNDHAPIELRNKFISQPPHS